MEHQESGIYEPLFLFWFKQIICATQPALLQSFDFMSKMLKTTTLQNPIYDKPNKKTYNAFGLLKVIYFKVKTTIYECCYVQSDINYIQYS